MNNLYLHNIERTPHHELIQSFKMTREHAIVLQLIKNVVREHHEELTKENVNWKNIIEFSTQHGMQGICFDALGLLPDEQRPDKASLLEWLGKVVCVERFYDKQKKTIDSLSDFYQEHGIKMMLLKGYGMSLYWPQPNHRPGGDIDIYLGSLWQQANKLVSEKLGIRVDDGHEHHTCFYYNGMMVENHYDFLNTKVNESARELEKVFKELAKFDMPLKMERGAIYLPSATLNAIFLLRHLGQHFAGAEATLRQVLDWGFFMHHETKNVDWNFVLPTLKKAGILRFFHQVNAICVDYLGFDESAFPTIVREHDLEKRIMENILSPEFDEKKPKGNTLQVIIFKTRRFFANKWKRHLVFRESIMNQLWFGSIAHLRRFGTIKD